MKNKLAFLGLAVIGGAVVALTQANAAKIPTSPSILASPAMVTATQPVPGNPQHTIAVAGSVIGCILSFDGSAPIPAGQEPVGQCYLDYVVNGFNQVFSISGISLSECRRYCDAMNSQLTTLCPGNRAPGGGGMSGGIGGR